MNAFGGLDSIIERSKEIESEKIRLAIEDGVDIIKRNMALISLNGNADIPFALEEIELVNPHIRTMDVIRGIGH